MAQFQIQPTIDYKSQPIKAETIAASPSTNTAPAMDSSTVGVETLEEEILEEEHLYDDSEVDYQGDSAETADGQPINEEALPKTGNPVVELDESANQLKLEISFDSEEEEQVTTPKYVFSWKELYKPKQSKAIAVTKKILEHRPKPNFVPHTCYICDTSYEDADGLDTHLEGHVNLLPYKCENCSTEQVPQQFKTLLTLNKHMQSHLYPYQCDFCPVRLLTMPTYEEHMRRYHGYQYEPDGHTCDFCGQHFENKKQFKVHHAKHRALDEEKYKCEFCGRVFCSNTLLQRHRRTHTGEKPFECKKCGKRFNHRDNFKNHMRAHINEKGHVCTECGKSFINSTYLRYHMAEHFPNDPQYRPQQRPVMRPRFNQDTDSKKDAPSEKVFECKFEGCGFVANRYGAYFYHKSMHEKKFQCELCQKRFHMNHALQKHIASVHEGLQPEKTLACKYCPKMFNCKNKLSVHLDGHENNRRHKCQYCDKSFVQKNNLTAHERIHTGERPYPCRMCPATFITSSRRTKHERTHQEEGSAQGQLEAENDEYEFEQLEEEMEEVPVGDEEMVEFAVV